MDIKDGLNPDKNLQNEKKFVSFAKRAFKSAKKHKEKRAMKVKENVEYLRKIDALSTEINDYSNRIITNRKHLVFYSPVLTKTVEYKAASAWIPEFTFEPEQTTGKGDDTYKARNIKRIHDFMLRIGGFYDLKVNAAYDLFTAGRCFFYRGWDTVEDEDIEKADIVKFRVPRWEDVYWTKDKHTFFMVEKYSPDELVYELGESIKDYEIKDGTPFSTEGSVVEFDKAKDDNKQIDVLYVFNDVQKVFGIIVGSGNEPFEYKSGKDYPWTTEKDKGYIPLNWVDASNVMTDGTDHPICDLDKISDLFRTLSVTMNSTLKRLEQAARTRRIVAVDGDPAQAKNDWIQSEMDQSAGYDIPYFYRATGDGARKLGAQQLDYDPKLGDALAMRDLIYDEFTMATGINYRLQGKGANTAEQERLRMQRELDVIDEMIELNTGNWNSFVQKNVDMLRGVNAAFLQENIQLEDEYTDRPETRGSTYDGIVKDVIDELDEFRFDVKVSINNSNNKRKQVEDFQKDQALQLILGTLGATPLAQQIALERVRDMFPNIKIDENQQMQQMPPQGGLPTQQVPQPQLPNGQSGITG